MYNTFVKKTGETRKYVEALLDKYTEDFVNSLNEDPESVEIERE